MKISTLRLPDRLVAARHDGDTYTEITGFTDVGMLLQHPNWQELSAHAHGPTHCALSADLAPVIPQPGKIICIGMNYREHILERGTAFPEHPTIFAKYADALAGASDNIPLPPEDDQLDWEGELAVIIGSPGRRINEADALNHVAGYTVLNDISMRGFQSRTHQWLQGKTWQNSTPVGPALATPDELPTGATIRTTIDGKVVQKSTIDDLLFEIPEIISYLSTIITLRPGDIISTGTPSGVGTARTPKRFLRAGEHLETTIEGIGALSNQIITEDVFHTERATTQDRVHLSPAITV